MSEFSDLANDHALFIGWFDWASAAGPLPIEVQTFQIWYLALYPGIVPFEGDSAAKRLFPKLAHLTRKRRKEVLRNEITKARRLKEVMSSPQTDRRPLIL